MTSMPARVAAEVVGTTFTTEDTGGGWTVELARLEGGAVLVLTDGLGGTDYFGRGYLAAALYRSEQAWLDSGDDSVAFGDTVAVHDADNIRRVVNDALAGAARATG